jgi:ferritin-like metal-binding protein YciE
MSLKREATAKGDSKGAEHLDKIIESIGQEIYRKKCTKHAGIISDCHH